MVALNDREPFIPSFLDDYPLDPYEFRLYARIHRRAKKGSCWESIPNMAARCQMSLAKTRIALRFLVTAGLISCHQRSGMTTQWTLNSTNHWLTPEQIFSLKGQSHSRQSRRGRSQTRTDTPTKFDRTIKSNTTSKSDRTTPLESDRSTPIKSDKTPLSNLIDEGTPIKYSNKGISPLTPQLEKEKENLEKIQARLSNCQFVGGEPLTSSTLLASKKDPVEENSSAASSSHYQNETKSKLLPESEVEVTTLTATTQSKVKKYDPALGIKEPEEWKTLQQKQFNWVPDGPWLQDNKLDASFIDWLASQWQKEYGGTIHQKRSDVLRHFKKDPANLAIAWEQYRSEHLHRYENAAVRMHNGLEIKPDEQQQLLTHARAVTNPLPDELNPVASAVEISQSLSRVSVFLPDVPTSESAKEEELTHGEEVDLPEVDSGSVSPYIDEVSVLASIPTEEDGSALNPGAYKEWNPSPIEGEPISLLQWQEKLAAFTNKLSLVKPPTAPQPTSPTELEELNQWLNDPILKPEVLSRVMRSDLYRVEFEEEGKSIQVVAVTDTPPSDRRDLSKDME